MSREETVVALCNRSAAFAFVEAWCVLHNDAIDPRANALADADAVVALKRPWTKGHFRKARALVGLDRLEEARDALVDGLQFEPDDKVGTASCDTDSADPKELNSFLKEIDARLAEEDA